MDDVDYFPNISDYPIVVAVRRNDKETVEHLWECYECGAMVIDFRKHAKWHDWINIRLT